MARKRKQKEIERLEKLKIARRKKYAEIKQDPILYALEIEKEKRRYKERKQKKQIKSVHEESPRDQREIRRKWREASKKYRQKKKEQSKEKNEVAPEVVVIAASATTDKDEPKNAVADPLTTQKSPVRPNLKMRKVKYRELKRRNYLLEVIQKLREENRNLKRKLWRLQKEKTGKKKEKENSSRKQITTIKEKKNEDSKLKKIVKKVREFYLDDANSTLGAGKKEFITRLKVQKQKRYMTSTQKVLHQKFMTKFQVKVSYTFFCKHRPFWVLSPKSSQRDTCKCVVHENVDLTIQALKKASIIDETNSTELIKKMCCSIYESKCLKRECESCKNKIIKFYEFDNDNNITYYRWVRARERVKSKKGYKIITITKKEEVVTKPKEIIKTLEASLPAFFEHCYKIHNQYTNMKHLKDSLPVNVAVIHADFSENYSLKYNQEVQSMHFGGSRQEISLHTAIIYNYDFEISSIKPTSVCTTSTCLKHDASAVWAHITPLIQKAIDENPFLDTIHFQTDSPTSQYRNKYVFYMIPELNKDFPTIKAITWNYSEAGHGKGAPDGVGGTIKRTVDSCVNHGVDVGTYQKFMRVIRENVENVTIFDVPESSITAKEKKFPNKLQIFRGTLAVHQVLWKKGNQNLTFRNASCFECDCETICTHGKHLGFLKVPKSDMVPCSILKTPVVPLIATKRQYGVLTNITNTASTSSDKTFSTVGSPSNISILSNKKLIIKKSKN